MRLLPAHRCFALAAVILAGMPLSIPSIADAAATETPNDLANATLIVRPDKLVDLDLAKLQARARVVYVSSGVSALSVRMIDDRLGATFSFSGSDLRPTVIVKLAQNQPLHRVSVAYETKAARLDVYLLNAVPKPPGNFRGLTPIATTVDLVDNGRTTVDFAPTGARYVAFQWTRDKASNKAFEVAEVSAFTFTPSEQVPTTLAILGNGQAPPVEPPIIPMVSPD